MNFNCLYSAYYFPSEWDKLAEHYFQRSVFLQHLEKYNPCKQRYYVCSENQKTIAAAVVYSLPVNVFSFASTKSVIQIQIIGIPCSVSCSGIFGSHIGIKALTDYIFSTEKGFVLMLNRKEKSEQRMYASGKTLPTVVLENRFSDWEEYLASLTSPYRRRLKNLMTDNTALEFSALTSAHFSEPMYRLYENVYEKSKAKLEKLNIDFFKNLPPEFQLLVCYHNKEVAGWNISLKDNNIFYFFLGGVDYRLNKTHSIYLRLLAKLVKTGIESRCQFIELGQTAEIPKMRMGGKLQPLYMQASHSNSFLNAVLKMSKPLLEYNRKTENNNPFKASTQ